MCSCLKRGAAKDNSDGRADSNRRFDEASTHAWKSLIKTYANLYIAHLDKNKGKCKQGFMQGLVEATTKVAAVLEINCNDIYNKVRRVQKEHKVVANACATVSLKTSESLAVADDANNNLREWPVGSASVSWSPTAMTMDNDGPDTVTAGCVLIVLILAIENSPIKRYFDRLSLELCNSIAFPVV
jgi:hypothetical protein